MNDQERDTTAPMTNDLEEKTEIEESQLNQKSITKRIEYSPDEMTTVGLRKDIITCVTFPEPLETVFLDRATRKTYVLNTINEQDSPYIYCLEKKQDKGFYLKIGIIGQTVVLSYEGTPRNLPSVWFLTAVNSKKIQFDDINVDAFEKIVFYNKT